MAKPQYDQPAGAIKELSLDDLGGITAGYGVLPPSPGFEPPKQAGTGSSGKAKWGSVAQPIDKGNGAISK